MSREEYTALSFLVGAGDAPLKYNFGRQVSVRLALVQPCSSVLPSEEALLIRMAAVVRRELELMLAEDAAPREREVRAAVHVDMGVWAEREQAPELWDEEFAVWKSRRTP